MGTWIEIRTTRWLDTGCAGSFPYWERGLKYEGIGGWKGLPLRRSLIGNVDWNKEALNEGLDNIGRSLIGNVDWNGRWSILLDHDDIVVPLLGTWIEITTARAIGTWVRSFPYWERGLKYQDQRRDTYKSLSFPYWERGLKLQCSCRCFSPNPGRSLIGNVDWNRPYINLEPINEDVVPLLGTWIEMV